MKKIHKEKQIYAFLDGRLSGRKAEALERHLEECRDCREFMKQAETIRENLRTLGSERPDRIDWQAAWNVIEANLEQGAGSRRRPALRADLGTFFWKLAFVTAVLLLVFAAYVGYEKYVSQRPEGGTVLTEKSEEGTTGDAAARLEAARPEVGRVTFTTRNVRWKLPGVSPKRLDIQTALREGASVETRRSGIAGFQVGKAAGIRVESSSSVTLSRVTAGEIALHLDRGSLSVDLAPERGDVKLTVITKEATVSVQGTLFSVTRRSERTAVVVGRGSVLVTPKKQKENAVTVKRSEGVRVNAQGDVSAMGTQDAKPEEERLQSVLFNIFKSRMPEEIVSVDVKGESDLAFLDVGGKKVASDDITMRVASKEGEVKLVTKNGSVVPLAYDIAGKKKGSVAFDLEEASGLRAPESKKPVRRTPAPKEKTLAGAFGSEEEGKEPSGFIDPFIIRVKILKKKGLMRACYEKYLAKKPDRKEIKARIAFTVGESGKVTEASCSCNVDDKELRGCLSGVVKSVLFPKPEGGPAAFEYPVTFTPK